MQTQTLLMLTPDELKKLIKEAVKDFTPQPEEKQEGLMSRQEVADYFQITLPTLRAWHKRGVLGSVKIGGRRYYKKHEIESLYNQRLKEGKRP